MSDPFARKRLDVKHFTFRPNATSDGIELFVVAGEYEVVVKMSDVDVAMKNAQLSDYLARKISARARAERAPATTAR